MQPRLVEAPEQPHPAPRLGGAAGVLGNGCLACGNQLAGKTPDCICDLLGGETVVSLRMHREGRRLSPVGFPPRGVPMSDNTERARAVQELLAKRSDADRPVTRFGRSGRRKSPVVPPAPMLDESSAAGEAAWRRYGEGGISRFGRGPAL